MMPLTKVTDMSYNRSPLGRLLGYGTFVMESAGQDQALRTVGWVADPDHTYRVICAEIFGADNREPVVDGGEHDHRFGEGPPDGPDRADYSTAIRIRPAGSDPRGSGPRESDIREADTGPISY